MKISYCLFNWWQKKKQKLHLKRFWICFPLFFVWMELQPLIRVEKVCFWVWKISEVKRGRHKEAICISLCLTSVSQQGQQWALSLSRWLKHSKQTVFFCFYQTFLKRDKMSPCIFFSQNLTKMSIRPWVNGSKWVDFSN